MNNNGNDWTVQGITYRATRDEMVWRADESDVQGLLITIEGCPIENDWEVVCEGNIDHRCDTIEEAFAYVANEFGNAAYAPSL